MQTPNEPFSNAPIPEPTGLINNVNYGGGNFTPGQPNGTLILVLGILGVTVCGFCAPAAWIMGNNALAEIDAGRGDPSQKGNANIGRIIGMIGSALMIVGLVFFFIIIALTAAGRRVQTNPNFQTNPSFQRR